MKSKKQFLPLFSLILSMTIFGTVGVFRRYIPIGSATLAGVRGYIGVVFILLVFLVGRKKPDLAAIRARLPLLLLSGAFIGINWILLFEAYERTTVAVATLCYYMAPVFAILLARVLYKEKITPKKGFCVFAAVIGMVGVSGVIGGGFTGDQISGVLYGLAAAAFYACVIISNQKLREVPAFDKTSVQLLAAAVVVTPYALLTETVDPASLSTTAVLLILAVGILHTGIAYSLYFGSMKYFGVTTVSLLGYIDPIVAVLLSVLFLKEPIGIWEIIGVILILGATVIGELPEKKE